jgi:altronate hydrolase
MNSILQIHPSDSVAVALQPITVGSPLVLPNGQGLQAQEAIGIKQKVVLQPLRAGDTVVMYGVPVGRTTQALAAGAQLRPGQIIHDAAPYSAAQRTPLTWQPPTSQGFAQAQFNGYLRSDGRVGTRNHWLVVPLVFCENRNIQTLQQALEEELGYGMANPYRYQVRQWLQQYVNNGPFSGNGLLHPVVRPFAQVDGLRFLTHEMGCGGSRQDAQTLCRLLAGYINHPNVGGATVLSLGCQNATIEWLQEALQQINPRFDKPLFIIDQQQTGSNDALLRKALEQTLEGLATINQLQRSPQPLHKLVLGLKCGGSDGFSGLSANPALGHASDLLVSLGGSSILAEFPELCGVEQELIDRCTDVALAEKFERLMRNYAALSESFGNPFHMNPSEGNIKDGLLTDAMKSAGAARKGGYAPISGVLDYAEQISHPGLQLLCTPGNDVEATTGIAGSGATVTVFTTGLGTPTGNPISPLLKISSNSSLQQRMPDVIDFDCGGIITGRQTIQQCGEALLQQIIQTANGEATQAEKLRQYDFIPWRKSISV